MRAKFEKGSFTDYEPGLCDLVRVIDLTLIALVEPEADARIVQVALENAQRMAADLNKKWYADCERLIEKVEWSSRRRTEWQFVRTRHEHGIP